MATISGLHHINIDTARPDETIAFYSEVFGFVNRPDRRPDGGQPGAWLFEGEQAIIHLNFIDDDRSGGTSSFNHAAFEGSGFTDFCARLDTAGIDYRVSDRPEISLKQIFVRDPNGVRLEINISGE